MTPLKRYLADAARRGFVWGEHDCILFAAGWVREVSGVDPAAAWRGGYLGEIEGRTLLAQLGGLSQVMGRALAACNWRSVSVVAFEAGDVVLAAPRDEAQHRAGIAVDARKIALLTRRGIVVASMPVLRAWRRG